MNAATLTFILRGYWPLLVALPLVLYLPVIGGIHLGLTGWPIRFLRLDHVLVTALVAWCLAAIPLQGLSLQRWWDRWRERLTHPGLLVAALGYVLFLNICLKIRQWQEYKIGALDFCLYEQAVASPFYHRLLWLPIRDIHTWSEHFNLWMFPAMALNLIWNSPTMLLTMHAAWLVLAGVPLYFLARQHFASGVVPLLLVVAYWSHRGYLTTLWYDVHFEVLFPAHVFVLLLFLERKAPLWHVALVTVSACAIKEDFGIYLAALGVTLMFLRRFREGALLIGIGALWTVVSVTVIIPAFQHNPEAKVFYAQRYAVLGETYGEKVQTLLLRPWIPLGTLFTRPVGGFLLDLGLLPLLAPVWALPWLAALGVNTLSSESKQANLAIYYSITALPFAVYGVLRALVWLRGALVPRLPGPPALVAGGKLAGTLAVLVICLNDWTFFVPGPTLQKVRTIRLALRLIPEGSEVVASNRLYPHLWRTHDACLFGVCTDGAYAFFDLTNNPNPFTQEKFRTHAQRIATSGEYEILLSRDNILLAKRRTPPE